MSEPNLVTREEAETVAAAMARRYRQDVEFYTQQIKWSLEEAGKHAAKRQDLCPQTLEEIEATPVSELGWTALQAMEAQQEGSSLALWERMKAQARTELLAGYRAAEMVTNRHLDAYEFARFVALWERLAEEWQPKGGLEEVLLDQLAQLHTMYEYWLSISYGRCQKEYQEPTDHQKRYELPRVDEQQAQEHAAAMADRYQRMFMRALRNLRELRRHPVIVHNAGQVNVGSQQINVAESAEAGKQGV